MVLYYAQKATLVFAQPLPEVTVKLGVLVSPDVYSIDSQSDGGGKTIERNETWTLTNGMCRYKLTFDYFSPNWVRGHTDGSQSANVEGSLAGFYYASMNDADVIAVLFPGQ